MEGFLIGRTLAHYRITAAGGMGEVYRATDTKLGRDVALKAVALAPSLWEVNFSRAFHLFYFERNWRAAEPYFRKAIEINPRSSLAQAYYGIFLATGKRHVEDAVGHMTLACELDPLSPMIHAFAAVGLNLLGRYDAAESAAQQALDLQADYMLGLWQRCLALWGLGRNEEAVGPLERAVTLSRAPLFVGLLGMGYARAGRREDAARLLAELEDRTGRGEYVPAFTRLFIHVGRRDLPAIRTALAQVLEEVTPLLAVRTTSGEFLEEFRSDPDIDRMLRELYRE